MRDYSVLYSFMGGTDGTNPYARLIFDASGNLYGTTIGGGASNAGTVFKISSAGAYSVLYFFTGGSDGANPYAGLIFDASGNLYGTTWGGGASHLGTVFKISSSGAYSALHSFAFGLDGVRPEAGLIFDASGNLYGTTGYGGASGNGTVFRIVP